MTRMVRKQVYIEPRHDALLKRRARELGVTEAELIRRGIEYITAADADEEEEREDAWAELDAAMEEAAQVIAPQTGRQWTREELYEERIDRVVGRHERPAVPVRPK